jgi:acetolactate synthase regulatory subunit
MNEAWNENIFRFIELCNEFEVKMLMVGGGAVNFYGYQRHSADVDFWIDTTPENLNRLLKVINKMGFKLNEIPEKVRNQNQNISIKFSPLSINIELITRFSIGKSFDEAHATSDKAEIEGNLLQKWNVLSFDDLILSKIKAGRPKDLLDIQELNRLKN